MSPSDGVDFLLDEPADPAEDDESTAAPRRRWPTVLAVLVVAAAVVVAVVAGRSSTRPNAVRPAPASSSTFTPAPLATVPGVSERASQTQFDVDLSPPASCAHRCTRSTTLPADFGAAVAKRFPHLHTVSRQTLREAGKVVYRGYVGTTGTERVQVAVRRGASGTPFVIDAGDDGVHTVVVAQHLAHGWTSAVQVTTPSGLPPSFAAVRLLASDPRLLPTA